MTHRSIISFYLRKFYHFFERLKKKTNWSAIGWEGSDDPWSSTDPFPFRVARYQSSLVRRAGKAGNITYKSIVPIPYVVEDAVSSTAVGRAALVLQWYCYVRWEGCVVRVVYHPILSSKVSKPKWYHDSSWKMRVPPSQPPLEPFHICISLSMNFSKQDLYLA